MGFVITPESRFGLLLMIWSFWRPPFYWLIRYLIEERNKAHWSQSAAVDWFPLKRTANFNLIFQKAVKGNAVQECCGFLMSLLAQQYLPFSSAVGTYSMITCIAESVVILTFLQTPKVVFELWPVSHGGVTADSSLSTSLWPPVLVGQEVKAPRHCKLWRWGDCRQSLVETH